jgi:hypothetical protein
MRHPRIVRAVELLEEARRLSDDRPWAATLVEQAQDELLLQLLELKEFEQVAR